VDDGEDKWEEGSESGLLNILECGEDLMFWI
jgi:hypothetical protein